MKPTRRSSAPALALLLAAIAFAPACSEGSDTDASIERNVSMARGYVDAMNRGDASYLDDYFGPGYVYHGPMGELDSDGFKKMHAAVLTAFPGAKITADDIIAAGDRVVTRWTLRGKQQGAFLGIAPTGKDVTVEGIIITRFENGRAVEEWEEADVFQVMQQLGAPAGAEDSGS